MSKPSVIGYSKTGNGVSFSGPEGVSAYAVASLMASMNLFKAGMRFRHCSGAQALKTAGQYTGKKYKRGQYDEARADLAIVLANKKAACEHETLNF